MQPHLDKVGLIANALGRGLVDGDAAGLEGLAASGCLAASIVCYLLPHLLVGSTANIELKYPTKPTYDTILVLRNKQ